jgi:hypothetical protein
MKKHTPLIRAIKDTTTKLVQVTKYTHYKHREKTHTTNQSKEMLHSPELLFSSAPPSHPTKIHTSQRSLKNTQVQPSSKYTPRSHGSAISMATAFDANSMLWDEWFNLEVGGRVS